MKLITTLLVFGFAFSANADDGIYLLKRIEGAKICTLRPSEISTNDSLGDIYESMLYAAAKPLALKASHDNPTDPEVFILAMLHTGEEIVLYTDSSVIRQREGLQASYLIKLISDYCQKEKKQ